MNLNELHQKSNRFLLSMLKKYAEYNDDLEDIKRACLDPSRFVSNGPEDPAFGDVPRINFTNNRFLN